MMKFNIYATYFNSSCAEWKIVMEKCLESFKHSEIKEDSSYEIEIKSLEDLKKLSQKLNKEYEKYLIDNNDCFSPAKLVVNFEDMTIQIYDFYIE